MGCTVQKDGSGLGQQPSERVEEKELCSQTHFQPECEGEQCGSIWGCSKKVGFFGFFLIVQTILRKLICTEFVCLGVGTSVLPLEVLGFKPKTSPPVAPELCSRMQISSTNAHIHFSSVDNKYHMEACVMED